MGEFESYSLQRGFSAKELGTYFFTMPLKLPQLRRLSLLTEKNFGLRDISEIYQLVTGLRLDCTVLTDRLSTPELRLEFLELEPKQPSRLGIVRSYPKTAEAIEVLDASSAIVAGCIDHLPSRYQLFLEKALTEIRQPVLVSNAALDLYKTQPELSRQPNHWFVLPQNDLVRLLYMLEEKPRSPRHSPTNSWRNALLLARCLGRSCSVLAPGQVIVADPATNRLDIIALPLPTRHYHLFRALIGCLFVLFQQVPYGFADHLRAAAAIWEKTGPGVGGNGIAKIMQELAHE